METSWSEWLLDRLVIFPTEAVLRRLDGRAFFETSEFPWAAEMEAHWEEIHAELEPILANPDQIPAFEEVSTAQLEITQDKRWKTFFLYVWGHRIDENCARCPRTESLLRRIPGMETAMFSILPAHKRIPEHRGYFGGVLRYHLALVVPKEAERCAIRVRDEVRWWELGKGMVFDDSLPHEVWNDTDETRVVLFVDVRRPVPFPLSAWVWATMRVLASTPLASEGVGNARAWARRLG